MAKSKKTDLEKSRETAAHWKSQIEQADKDPKQKRWKERCDKIIKAYRDERFSTDSSPDTNKRLNIYWSNVETLKPAIYSKTPDPIVERRFLDRDPVGKVAAQILERALRYEMPNSDFHHTMKLTRNDYLLTGRGVPWVRYNPTFGESVSLKTVAEDEITDNSGQELDAERDDKESYDQEVLESESLCVDYVNWNDFIILGKPRVWSETEAIAKRAFLSRHDLTEKFGDKIGKAIPLDHSAIEQDSRGAASESDKNIGEKATIYEIWCKYEKKVYFIAKGYEQVCLEVDDPLGLERFFPCPRPVFTNATNDTLVPVPDYVEAQDQYIQINDLTRRIDILTDACRVAGVYDASQKAISRLFTEAKEPQLIPVDQYAAFAEKGGMKGTIEFVPIDMIAKTLEVLIGVRKQILEDLDRLTGVWDIMRGETDAQETLGAQKIKQQNGFGRLGERQEEFARMCRDTICIMGEIISEHYSPKTLIQISGALFDEGLVPQAQPPQPPIQAPMQPGAPPPAMAAPPQGPQPPGSAGAPMPGMPPGIPMGPMAPPPPSPQQIQAETVGKALELLKSEKLRGFRIDIETDSTIQPDANQEKAARIEFIGGVTKFLQEGGMLAMQMPTITPLLGKMLMFAVRGFRVGRDLESAIEEFADQAEKQSRQQASQPKQPGPEEIKLQTAMIQMKGEIERQQVENQGTQVKTAADIRGKEIDLQLRQIELQMKQIEHDMKVHTANMDIVQSAVDASGGDGGSSAEGGGSSKPQGFAVHPHVALKQIGDAADKISKAAALISAPKVLNRGPDGKVHSIVTQRPEGIQ